MSSELIEYIKAKQADYLNLYKKIIELESPTNNKAATDKLVDFIESYLKEQGVQVTRVKNEQYGDHLLGEWGEGEEQILYLGHLDTVWDVGTLAKMPFEVKEGKIFGPGVYDMKGGIFQGLYALKLMNELNMQPKYKVVFLFNTDEEVGSPSSWDLIEEVAKQSKYVFVAEPGNLPNGSVKTSRKGFGIFDVTITGIPSHAGADPEKGVSAIHEFARQVLYLESLADLEKGTTINVGVVHGGTRANVVAAEVQAKIDLRVEIMEEAERIVPLIQGLQPIHPQIHLQVQGGLNRPPMEKTEQIERLFKQVRKLAGEEGFELGDSSSGGVSDGNITAALGIPTLCGLGVVGRGAHAVDEHCLLEYIPKRIALVMRIFTDIT